MTAIRAGAIYFAIVFAVGFMLGTFRVLVLSPSVGETAATLIEGPFILGASWVACGFVIERFYVPTDRSPRLIMGTTAFSMLISAELLLSVFGFGQTLNEVVARYTTVAGAIGLAGQVLFGLFPLLRKRRDG